MADKKISELPASATPLAGTETFPLVQSGQTVKAAISAITDRLNLGTMSTQDADNVAVTGGAIDGVPVGATSASTGKFILLDVDNVRVDGNTVSVTNTDGNLSLSANGTGFVTSNYRYRSVRNDGVGFHVLNATDFFYGFVRNDGFDAYSNTNSQAPVVLRTAGTAKLTVGTNSDITANLGNFVIGTAGKGIDFSADSSAAGMTSELLDDYEEGTWTPTVGGVSIGAGKYTKIGRLVFIEFVITANSVSTITIDGLPFNVSSASAYGGLLFGQVRQADVLDANGVPFRIIFNGLSGIQFRTNVVNADDATVNITTSASGTVRVGITGVGIV